MMMFRFVLLMLLASRAFASQSDGGCKDLKGYEKEITLTKDQIPKKFKERLTRQQRLGNRSIKITPLVISIVPPHKLILVEPDADERGYSTIDINLKDGGTNKSLKQKWLLYREKRTDQGGISYYDQYNEILYYENLSNGFLKISKFSAQATLNEESLNKLPNLIESLDIHFTELDFCAADLGFESGRYIFCTVGKKSDPQKLGYVTQTEKFLIAFKDGEVDKSFGEGKGYINFANVGSADPIGHLKIIQNHHFVIASGGELIVSNRKEVIWKRTYENSQLLDFRLTNNPNYLLIVKQEDSSHYNRPLELEVIKLSRPWYYFSWLWAAPLLIPGGPFEENISDLLPQTFWLQESVTTENACDGSRFCNRTALMKYNRDLTLDKQFGNNGIVEVLHNGEWRNMIINPENNEVTFFHLLKIKTINLDECQRVSQ